MIDFVSGIINSVEPEGVVVNVNGIGYYIYLPNSNQYLSQINQECLIYTHHYMREDWMGLFGFNDKEERELFRMLISVSGIGPKGALAIIAQREIGTIVSSIANEDEKTLCKFPGIGKKTAQRIILDLKDKMKDFAYLSTTDQQQSLKDKTETTTANTDLIDALLALGYSETEINNVTSQLSDSLNELSLDKLIKKALQILMNS